MPVPEFYYDEGNWKVTEAMRQAYESYGCVIIRNMLSSEEVSKVKVALEDPQGVLKYSFKRSDGKERDNSFVLWNHPGRDVTGVLARTQRIAGTAEELMGGEEIYHYHTKLVMKAAHTGGTFVWHQDYGYWYKNGCLAPDMSSVFIPMDDTDHENGCLQVIPGSHKYGRIDHVDIGEQLGADPERVEQAKKRLNCVLVEMKAGDVLFFHCNLLHTSAANTSPRRRWVFIVAFNKRSNDSYKDHHHARYTPMTKEEDSALLKCTETNLDGKWFMTHEEDFSIPRNVH